jgi:hypothetical protein
LEIQSALGSVVDLAPTSNLEGYGSVASVTGEGGIVLDHTVIEAGSSSASRYAFVFGSSGDPVLGNPASSGNAALILENAPTGVLELDLYLSGSAQASGAVSRGGLIVPALEDLIGALSWAAVRVFSSDLAGSHQFGDQSWTQISNYSLKVVPADLGQAAPFEQVKILELTNGPADSFEDWRQRTFSAAELADPLISRPQASPFGDGMQNLLRYAFGVPAGENASGYLPRIKTDSSGIGVEFPYDGSRDDLKVVVESSDSLQDWTGAVILFDSSMGSPPVANELRRIRIVDSRTEVQSRFYRVRIVQN